MNFNIIVTLLVLIFMSVMFMTRKLSYGITGMICMLILAFTGVVDLNTALSGFSSTTTILIATMLLVAGCIGKTSLVSRIRSKMSVIQKQNGTLLLLGIILITIVLTPLVGMTALMSIMLLLVTTLDDDSEFNPGRIYFLVAAINSAWFGRFPIGMGAALPIIQNGYYEGLVNGNQEDLLTMFDYLKVGIIPSVALTVYCLLAWKLIPKTKLDASMAQQTAASQKQSTLTSVQEAIVWIVFAVVMVSFLFSNQLGGLIYLLPIAGCIVLILSGVVSPREASATLAGDMVFCVAGVLVVSAALNSSGAGELIGNFVLHLLGDHPSSLLVITVFCVVTTIMTTFLSNSGTIAIMTPIAASTAIAGGMNPKAVVLVIYCASCLAIAFPTGCASAMLAFSVGNQNPGKLLKFTIPYLLIGMATIILSASILYPVYG